MPPRSIDYFAPLYITSVCTDMDADRARFQKLTEKLLLLQTPLTLTSLTPQPHLPRTAFPTPQVLDSNIRQRLYKHGAPVQTLRPLDTRVAGLMDNLLVEFVERFDVVACESDRDEDEVCLALSNVMGYCVGGLGAEPGGGADLGLPA